MQRRSPTSIRKLTILMRTLTKKQKPEPASARGQKMASLRKRYQTQDAPVMSPPQITAAELPEPVADAKPPEPVVESSPAEEAGKAALRQRLEEMERA